MHEWSRAEGERRIREVLDNAKAGSPQTISDVDGSFEIRFVAISGKEPAGDFLSRGGPDKQ
ncbi:hypothetical protein CN071_11975 [Sinorhizobium meliloti]|nr:hypothetical protein CN220_31830 [Sinorhizobium meliloti]RVH41197.1 hypothetical protein CN212_31150 [Sinorhizobium meliloti]RVJ47356.1 hypothetical protein CN175_28070 [Sinorhizobium meliloti]RVJ66376.1 hypothetical protein CN171_31540 [Sinorhizobium meliloti]RVP68733.1 hypothetical protein CN071_11975 [Sinorhizobium meliloti]